MVIQLIHPDLLLFTVDLGRLNILLGASDTTVSSPVPERRHQVRLGHSLYHVKSPSTSIRIQASRKVWHVGRRGGHPPPRFVQHDHVER
jgi:hypothetical protein